MRAERNRPAVAISVVLCLLAPAAGAQTGQSLLLSQEARENLGIELAAAAQRDLYEILEVRGMMREQADRTAWVTPTAKGQIVEVLRKEADSVERGEVLLVLHCPELERLRTELAQGIDRLDLLEREAARVRSLVERGVLSPRDLVRAETEHRLARSQVEAARRGILLLGLTPEELEDLLEEGDRPAYLPLHAPISGRIAWREAFVGEMVAPGRRLFRIMDISVLWAEADVFERDVPRVREGLEVGLAWRSFKDWRFQGVIKAVSPNLDAQKRTAHLWIEVENPDGRLKPQMAVDLSILVGRKAQALAVPREAVLEERGERFVFVLNGEAFLRQPVVTGMADHRHTEIREGLYAGDQVVVKGNHELRLAFSSEGAAAGGHLH